MVFTPPGRQAPRQPCQGRAKSGPNPGQKWLSRVLHLLGRHSLGRLLGLVGRARSRHRLQSRAPLLFVWPLWSLGVAHARRLRPLSHFLQDFHQTQKVRQGPHPARACSKCAKCAPRAVAAHSSQPHPPGTRSASSAASPVNIKAFPTPTNLPPASFWPAAILYFAFVVASGRPRRFFVFPVF